MNFHLNTRMAYVPPETYRQFRITVHTVPMHVDWPRLHGFIEPIPPHQIKCWIIQTMSLHKGGRPDGTVILRAPNRRCLHTEVYLADELIRYYLARSISRGGTSILPDATARRFREIPKPEECYWRWLYRAGTAFLNTRTDRVFDTVITSTHVCCTIVTLPPLDRGRISTGELQAILDLSKTTASRRVQEEHASIPVVLASFSGTQARIVQGVVDYRHPVSAQLTVSEIVDFARGLWPETNWDNFCSLLGHLVGDRKPNL